MLYTIPACIALFIVLVILGRRYLRIPLVPFVPFVLFLAICGFISYGVGALSCGLLRDFVPRQVVTNTYTLAAMHGADTIHGSFVYGTGSLGSVMMYRVYVKNDNGSVSPYQIPASSNVEIVQKDDLKDVGYWKRTVRKFDYSTTPLAHWVIQSPDEETLLKTELVVPAGTFVHSFSAQ
jgi:hypothetical protein